MLPVKALWRVTLLYTVRNPRLLAIYALQATEVVTSDVSVSGSSGWFWERGQPRTHFGALLRGLIATPIIAKGPATLWGPPGRAMGGALT